MRTIRIGSGAGYSGDRIEPAVELAEKGDIQYLVFECLGERTVALAQQARMKNPESGFDPLLEERMRAVLPICAAKGKVASTATPAVPAMRRKCDLNGFMKAVESLYASCLRKRSTLKYSRTSAIAPSATKLGQSVSMPLPFNMQARAITPK